MRGTRPESPPAWRWCPSRLGRALLSVGGAAAGGPRGPGGRCPWWPPAASGGLPISSGGNGGRRQGMLRGPRGREGRGSARMGPARRARPVTGPPLRRPRPTPPRWRRADRPLDVVPIGAWSTAPVTVRGMSPLALRQSSIRGAGGPAAQACAGSRPRQANPMRPVSAAADPARRSGSIRSGEGRRGAIGAPAARVGDATGSRSSPSRPPRGSKAHPCPPVPRTSRVRTGPHASPPLPRVRVLP